MTREQFIDTYKSIEEQMRSLDKNEDMFKVISNNVEFFQFLAPIFQLKLYFSHLL